MTQAKILISGASGNVGRALIERLSEAGLPIKAMARSKRRLRRINAENIEVVEADLSDPESLAKAFEGVDQAFIATAIAENAVELFDNFFAQAKQAGVKQVVKLSGFGASENSRSEILRQHHESDRLLIESGLNYTILQPNSFYQNLLWQAPSIKSKGRFRLPLGQGKQSFIDIRDVAEAGYRTLSDSSHHNKTYRLTGPEALNCDEMAEQLSQLLGKTIRYQAIEASRAEKEMLANDITAWNAHALAEIQQEFSSGDYAEICDDFSLVTGRNARTFQMFIDDHRENFQ